MVVIWDCDQHSRVATFQHDGQITWRGRNAVKQFSRVPDALRHEMRRRKSARGAFPIKSGASAGTGAPNLIKGLRSTRNSQTKSTKGRSRFNLTLTHKTRKLCCGSVAISVLVRRS
jgi:hypothetical protein